MQIWSSRDRNVSLEDAEVSAVALVTRSRGCSLKFDDVERQGLLQAVAPTPLCAMICTRCKPASPGKRSTLDGQGSSGETLRIKVARRQARGQAGDGEVHPFALIGVGRGRQGLRNRLGRNIRKAGRGDGKRDRVTRSGMSPRLGW